MLALKLRRAEGLELAYDDMCMRSECAFTTHIQRILGKAAVCGHEKDTTVRDDHCTVFVL
jgi:hypothetical protein